MMLPPCYREITIKGDIISMATLVSANYNGYHHNFNDLTNCIKYILNRNKIKNRYYGVTGMIIPNNIPFDKIGDYIAGRMIETALPYDRPNTIKIRHLIVSFDRNELTDPTIADDIARKCLTVSFSLMFGIVMLMIPSR